MHHQLQEYGITLQESFTFDYLNSVIDKLEGICIESNMHKRNKQMYDRRIEGLNEKKKKERERQAEKNPGLKSDIEQSFVDLKIVN